MGEEDVIAILAEYNRGCIEGEWRDIVDAVTALESELEKLQTEQYERRTKVIRAFIAKKRGAIKKQHDRAVEFASRIERALVKKRNSDKERSEHDSAEALNELAEVMHNLNTTVMKREWIVRLQNGDDQALSSGLGLGSDDEQDE